MNVTLTDDNLTHLMGEGASAYPAPEQGPASILAELGDAEPGKPWLRRRGVQLTAVAAAVILAAVLAQSVGGPGASLKQTTATRNIQRTAPNPRSLPGTVRAPAPVPTAGSDKLSGAAGNASSNAVPAVPGANQPRFAAAPDESQTRALSSSQLSNGESSLNSNLSAAPVGDGASARVVKTGSISLIVDDGKVTATVSKLQDVAKRARGYISDEQSQEFGDNPSATVTMRVPVDAFEGVLLQLRSKAFGAKVVSAQSSGRDVTAQYADTEAQIASLRAARARFLTILAGAKTIGETLTVQQRVDDVQGQIDRLEGQRRVLANQSDLATVTATVGEQGAAVLKTTEPSGLSKAWSDAKHGFTSGVEGLIAHSGRALLVLLVAALALVMSRFGWRLARRRLV